ncbi:hypothetical protein BDN67DRAFT_969160 [Paxillus ammoniavirescens]|nr:hypothetical protein BDN67DRAFT_969160 [Paxillus ammoniavirescens]
MSQTAKASTHRPKILQIPSTTSSSSAAVITPVMQNPVPPPTLIEFVSATPPPLTFELVALAPYIAVVRHIAQIFSWESVWEESWLALAGWWALCMLSEPTLKFFLPFGIFFVFTLKWWTSHAVTSSVTSPPATENTVHAVVSDLTTIHALLPSSPFSDSLIPPSLTLIRMAAFTYPPYLILTYFVPLRICIAITGTLVLTHRARWARNARTVLVRSAHLRWGFYRLYSLFSGEPLPMPTAPSPPPEYASRPVSGITEYTNAASHTSEPNNEDDTTPRPSPPLRFLFTVYENQRWWMGLDWTAALLPGERPSWCSASQVPLPPPSAFSLPPPTTSFVPVGKNGRAKRVARWGWEEPEWRVLVRREGQDGLWRIEKTPPKDKDAADEGSGTAARMLRAARGRDSGGAGTSGATETPERDKSASADQHISDPSIIPGQEDDVVTDPEGWVYGDNKWEGASGKGGMGKYTRYRRWTRIATLTEMVELVGPGEFGVLRDSGAFSTFSGENTASMFTAGATSPTASSFSDWESAGSVPEPQKESQPGGTKGMLRQRLKAAVDGSGH